MLANEGLAIRQGDKPVSVRATMDPPENGRQYGLDVEATGLLAGRRFCVLFDPRQSSMEASAGTLDGDPFNLPAVSEKRRLSPNTHLKKVLLLGHFRHGRLTAMQTWF